MKIKLSKSQWEGIGLRSGWIKIATSDKYIDRIEGFLNKARSKSFVNPEAYALGALKEAIVHTLFDIEQALDGVGYVSLSGKELGAEEIINKIIEIVNRKDRGK